MNSLVSLKVCFLSSHAPAALLLFGSRDGWYWAHRDEMAKHRTMLIVLLDLFLVCCVFILLYTNLYMLPPAALVPAYISVSQI